MKDIGRIKRLIAGGVCAACLCGSVAGAQDLKGRAETDVQTHTYLKVRMQLDLSSLRLGKAQSKLFTPVLTDGTNRQALRPVRVSGKWRQILYRRQNGNGNRNGDGAEAWTDVLCTAKGAGMVDYADSCIYLPWMKGAQVVLAQDLCGCGGDIAEQTQQLLTTVQAGVPETELVPKRQKEISGTDEDGRMCHKITSVTLFLSYLTFPAGHTGILPDFGNNREELRKLENTLDSLLALPDVRIERVDMTGYASPDGPYFRNEKLAYGRTLALRDYLQENVLYRPLPFSTASVAEDWEGLKAALETSAMPYRTELLQIIATDRLPDEKEENIKRLDGGKAYRMLTSDFLPQLRRTVCEIHYTETYETK